MNTQRITTIIFITFLFAMSWFHYNINAQTTWTIGSGTGSNTSISNPAPFSNNTRGTRQQYVYRLADLTATGMTAGPIHEFGFNVTALNGCGVLEGFSIKMRHSTPTTLATNFQTQTFTTVLNPVNCQPAAGWNIFTLDQAFEWNGTQSIVVEVCFYSAGTTANASTEWSTVVNNISRSLPSANSVCGITTGNTASNMRPNARFIRYPQTYTSSTVTQAGNVNITKGSNNAVIICVQVVMSGNDSPLNLTQLNFNTSGTSSPSSDISSAKVYYTGTTNSFSTSALFGSISSPDGAFNITGSQTLASGTNYFWLAYDIPSNAPVSDVVDAQCTEVTIGGDLYLPTVSDPAGSRTIIAPVTEAVIGSGTSSNQPQEYPAPFGNFYQGARHQFIYRASELQAAGFNAGDFSAFGFNVTAVNGSGVHENFSIKMKNSAVNNLTSFQTGMTEVLSSTSHQPVVGWNMFNLDTPFSWDGTSNIIVEICFYTPPENAPPQGYTLNASTEWTANLGTGTTRYLNNDNDPGICGSITGGNLPQTSQSRPNAKFEKSVPQAFNSTTTSQPLTSAVSAGSSSAVIIAVQVVVIGGLNPLSVTQINFNTTGSTDPPGDLTNAKVYYTGTNSSFSTASQFGSTFSSPNGTFNVSGSQALADGTNYFWLAYGISALASDGNVIDAQCTQITVGGVGHTPSVTDPAGSRTIAVITGPSSVIIGSGTGSNGNAEYPAPFGNYYMGARHQFIYRASELIASGFTGSIERFGFNVIAVNGSGIHNDFTIKMKNSSANNLTGFESGLTTVLNPANYQPVEGWNIFSLDTPFEWDGVSNIIVETCFYTDPYTTNASTEWSTGLGEGTTWYLNNDDQPGICGATTGANAPQTSQSRPNALFGRNADQEFSSAITIQPNTNVVSRGSTDAALIALQVVIQGNLNPLTLTNLDFNTTGSTNPSGDIENAKVYFTGSSSSFSTSTQFGSTVNSPSGSFGVTGSQALTEGTNYFWLSYDIKNSATINNYVDGQCTQFTLNGNNIVPAETNPSGARQILANTDSIYVHYNAGGGSSVNSADPLPPTSMASYLSAGGITHNAASFATNAYYTYQWPTTTDINKYLEFTLTPLATHHLQLRSISMLLNSGTGDDVANVAIRTSVDNYASDAAIINLTENGQSLYSANLSLVPETAGPITIRLYPYGGSGNRQFMVYPSEGIKLYGLELDQSQLPVELSSFSASSERLNATLKWTTATEVNNYGFEIQRSEARGQKSEDRSQNNPKSEIWNSKFESVGFVEGNGNSNSVKEYKFIDKHLPAGKYLYRLKQIDADGMFEYSEEIEVEVGSAPLEFNLAQNYPNPFNPETSIEFTLPENGMAMLKVFNILGEEVAVLFNEFAEAGKYYQTRFDASNLAAGVYIARLQFERSQIMKKMIYLK